MERGDNESDRSISPELAPVELPDWVKDYLIAKQKALEALKGKEGKHTDSSNAVKLLTDCTTEGDRDVYEFEPSLSDAPHKTGIALDSTGNDNHQYSMKYYYTSCFFIALAVSQNCH